MRNISNKAKAAYLIVLIFFITIFGLFWMDYIGLVDMSGVIARFTKPVPSVVDASDDEPSLIAKEEFEKEKQRLRERIEELDTREMKIAESEKMILEELDKIEKLKSGLEFEKKKLENEKTKYTGYKQNVKVLADKINSMPPDDSVKIMINWEETLIIDVLRQMDEDSRKLGKVSITSYLITLMPKEKASRIMYLMTQI